MQNKNAIYNGFAALFIILLQLFVFRALDLWGIGFCYIYVSVLILIPVNFPKTYALFVAFCLGLFIDMFYSTPGVNAFACVFLVYIKPIVFKAIPRHANFETSDLITPSNIGLINFIALGFILLLAHHFLIFQLEAYDSEFIWSSLTKAVMSTLFTLTSTIIVFYLVFSSKGRR